MSLPEHVPEELEEAIRANAAGIDIRGSDCVEEWIEVLDGVWPYLRAWVAANEPPPGQDRLPSWPKGVGRFP